MAISDRQAAAIRRRKADKETDRRLADERSRLALVLPDMPEPAANPDLVGWAIFEDALAGDGHQCITCHPTRPSPDFLAVYRFRLAARRPCRTCGAVLETVVRQAVTAGEKKD